MEKEEGSWIRVEGKGEVERKMIGGIYISRNYKK
jgi:hypothetical protein